MKKPETLTPERALSVLPRMELNKEWVRKKEAGELPAGMAGMAGSMNVIWPEETLTMEEADYILSLSEQGTKRWLSSQIFGFSNQILGMDLIDAARRVRKS